MRSFIILFFSVFTIFSANAGESVTLAGSTTVFPIMEKMSPLFKKQGIDIKLQAGGSSVGYKTAVQGMADFGMMSRDMKKSEAKNLNDLVISRDWLVMVAHKDSPLDNITSDEVVDIYTGKTNKLHGYKINAVTKESGRGTKKVFDHFFHFGRKHNRPIASNLIIIGPNGQSIATVAQDPNALAYLSYSAVEAAIKQGEPVKMLKLDGVAGTPENVMNGKYKLQRSLHLVYRNEKTDLMKRMRSVMASPEGQKIFKEQGVIPAL
jgi:phosphate transport system substrate-binding protein